MLIPCAATGCNLPVKPAVFMCARHWRRLPQPLQQALWSTYRSGGRPSPAYARAAREAIGRVAQQEGRAPDFGPFDSAERPRKTRAERRRVVCGICRGLGHNRLRCPEAEPAALMAHRVDHRMNGHSSLTEPNMRAAIQWAAVGLAGLVAIGLAVAGYWRRTGRRPWTVPNRGRD